MHVSVRPIYIPTSLERKWHNFEDEEKALFYCFESIAISSAKKVLRVSNIILSERKQLTMKNALAALVFMAFAIHLAHSQIPGNHCSFGYEYCTIHITSALTKLSLGLVNDFSPALLRA